VVVERNPFGIAARVGFIAQFDVDDRSHVSRQGRSSIAPVAGMMMRGPVSWSWNGAAIAVESELGGSAAADSPFTWVPGTAPSVAQPAVAQISINIAKVFMCLTLGDCVRVGSRWQVNGDSSIRHTEDW
jgi:hypothetical protein